MVAEISNRLLLAHPLGRWGGVGMLEHCIVRGNPS